VIGYDASLAKQPDAVRRDEAIAYCVSLPGAYLDHPWGDKDNVVEVDGKIFAFLGGADGPLGIAMKNTPERSTSVAPAIRNTPARSVSHEDVVDPGRHHWTRLAER
jgi:predicted DNA-binding protein (MmcQ/YjbR family)